MNKSVKTLVCVLVVSDLMIATGIPTQINRYPRQCKLYGIDRLIMQI